MIPKNSDDLVFSQNFNDFVWVNGASDQMNWAISAIILQIAEHFKAGMRNRLIGINVGQKGYSYGRSKNQSIFLDAKDEIIGECTKRKIK